MTTIKYNKTNAGEYDVIINGMNVARVIKSYSASRTYWYIQLTKLGVKYQNTPSCSSMQMGGWNNWDSNRKSIVYSRFEKLLSK